MSAHDEALAEALGDVRRAAQELQERRDRSAAQYEEKLDLLKSLEAELEDGAQPPKAVQTRVRELVAERSSGAGLRPRAMRPESVPAVSIPHAKAPLALGSKQVVTAQLQKTLQVVSTRLMELLGRPAVGEPRDNLCELVLLQRLHGQLSRGLGECAQVGSDTVVRETLVEQAGWAQQVVSDLAAGGPGRCRRLLEFERELVAQLRALGTDITEVRAHIARLQAELSATAPATATDGLPVRIGDIFNILWPKVQGTPRTETRLTQALQR